MSKFSNIELWSSQTNSKTTFPYAVNSTPLGRNSTIAQFQFVPGKTVEKENLTVMKKKNLTPNTPTPVMTTIN